MPIFNYVREHRRFIRYASDNKLTSGERILWYALVEIINEESESNQWTDEFIRISNNRVLMYCDPMGEDTMFRARNALKQRGLIDFRPGNRNKENPAYRVNLFYPDGCPQNTGKNTESYPHFAGNIWGNVHGNIQGNMMGNTQGNARDNVRGIYPNQNVNSIHKGFWDEDDEDELNDDETAREDHPDFSGLIRDAFVMSLGRKPTPEQMKLLARPGVHLGFSAEMIAEAIRIAAQRGAGDPVRYALTVLQDWWDEDVMIPDQIQTYQFLSDAASGRNDFGTGDPVEDRRRLAAAHEERIRENAEKGIPCKSNRLRVAEG